MAHADVPQLINKIRSDASSQIKGYLYQFIVAVDYCFQLEPNQSLYIEKYGDISLKNDDGLSVDDISVEVKLYSDDLNVNHHNLLNTLYNWIQPDFKYENYRSLIIYTNQPFSSGSLLIGWNEKSVEQRVQIITNSYKKYISDNKNKLEHKDSTKYKTIRSNAHMMNELLASEERLKSVLSRVIIRNLQGDFIEAYRALFKYARNLDDKFQEIYVNSLLGYVISVPVVNDSLCITYEGFKKETTLLTKELMPREINFPVSLPSDIDEKEYEHALFVHKLKQVDFSNKEITNAMNSYAKTSLLLTNDFKRPSSGKYLDDYQGALMEKYDNEYANACDGLLLTPEQTEKQIKAQSRRFHRELCTSAQYIKLYPYGTPPAYFVKGMYHALANSTDLDVKWLLENE